MYLVSRFSRDSILRDYIFEIIVGKPKKRAFKFAKALSATSFYFLKSSESNWHIVLESASGIFLKTILPGQLPEGWLMCQYVSCTCYFWSCLPNRCDSNNGRYSIFARILIREALVSRIFFFGTIAKLKRWEMNYSKKSVELASKLSDKTIKNENKY